MKRCFHVQKSVHDLCSIKYFSACFILSFSYSLLAKYARDDEYVDVLEFESYALKNMYPQSVDNIRKEHRRSRNKFRNLPRWWNGRCAEMQVCETDDTLKPYPRKRDLQSKTTFERGAQSQSIGSDKFAQMVEW